MVFDKTYYSKHTCHYQKQNLQLVPSFVVIKQMMAPKKKEKILDAGCGTGYLLDFVTEKKALGFGVDISAFAIAKAKKNYPDNVFKKADITNLPFHDEYFDKIVCFNVIEHIKDQDKALKELHRVLKNGGILVMGTNIKDSLSWRLFKFFLGGDSTHIHEFKAVEFVGFIGQKFLIDKSARSSCIARFYPFFNKLLSVFLKGDIIVKAKKKNS